MSTQNQGKQPRSVPPPPPPVAAHSRPGVRRQSMDDLLDDFIVRANQRVSSIRSRQWDLLVPVEEVDASQIISDEPPVAVHAAPVIAAAPVQTTAVPSEPVSTVIVSEIASAAVEPASVEVQPAAVETQPAVELSLIHIFFTLVGPESSEPERWPTGLAGGPHQDADP